MRKFTTFGGLNAVSAIVPVWASFGKLFRGNVCRLGESWLRSSFYGRVDVPMHPFTACSIPTGTRFPEVARLLDYSPSPFVWNTPRPRRWHRSGLGRNMISLLKWSRVSLVIVCTMYNPRHLLRDPVREPAARITLMTASRFVPEKAHFSRIPKLWLPSGSAFFRDLLMKFMFSNSIEFTMSETTLVLSRRTSQAIVPIEAC